MRFSVLVARILLFLATGYGNRHPCIACFMGKVNQTCRLIPVLYPSVLFHSVNNVINRLASSVFTAAASNQFSSAASLTALHTDIGSMVANIHATDKIKASL